MTVQELIDKLEDLKKEFGNMQVVVKDPTNYAGQGSSVIDLNIWGGEETVVYSGSWGYKALKLDIWD